MPEWAYPTATLIVTLGGVVLAYRNVSFQIQRWQEESKETRDAQHQDNIRRLDRIEASLETKLTPVWQWWLNRHDGMR